MGWLIGFMLACLFGVGLAVVVLYELLIHWP